MGKRVYRWQKPGVFNLLGGLLSALLLIGCAAPAAYREPIARFQQASTIVIEGARVEYGAANRMERDAVIDRFVAERRELNLRILNDKEMRIFGGDDLAARMAALDALNKHGQLLLALASSDAPARARDAANALDDALMDLSRSLGNVPADEFRNRAEGFAAIAAEMTGLALEAEIRKALDQAITLSANHVAPLIRLIRNDMNVLYERRRSILSAARVAATTAYNEEVRKPEADPEKLKRAASEIKKIEDAWDRLPLLLGSGAGLDAMAQTHQQLVAYARSSKTPQDLSELIDATDAFVTRARIIMDAVHMIRESKE